MKKQYSIKRSPFYKLRSSPKLRKILGVSESELKKFTSSNRSKNYSETITKNKRSIQIPKFRLKQIHRRIHRLFQRIEIPEWVKSGKKGESHITNALYHLQSKHFLSIDIEKFYQNSSYEFILKFFLYEMKMGKKNATIMTNIVTYMNIETGKIFLPTGSPSSQIIAYFVYSKTFDKINNLIKRYGCKMSLYVDDITISSKKHFPKKTVLYLVEKELNKVNLHVKKGKIKFAGLKENKNITGCIVTFDNKIRIPNKNRKKTKYSEKEYLKNKDNKTLKILYGLLMHSKQIQPLSYREKIAFFREQIKK